MDLTSSGKLSTGTHQRFRQIGSTLEDMHLRYDAALKTYRQQDTAVLSNIKYRQSGYRAHHQRQFPTTATEIGFISLKNM